jgi:excisionase family DNA binding protein
MILIKTKQRKQTNMKKSAFTTSDIAKISHHTRETVKRWLERGEINGYRVGASGHWRVLPEDLAIFLKKNNIPYPAPEEKGIDLKSLADTVNLPVFCWEFYKNRIYDHIRPEQSCKDCLVYKTKSVNCYTLREEVGHKKIHCNYSCKDCAYFHFNKEVATRGLSGSG